MKDQLKETPDQLMFKNFEQEIRKILKELKVQEVSYGDKYVEFLHRGYYFKIEVKQVRK